MKNKELIVSHLRDLIHEMNLHIDLIENENDDDIDYDSESELSELKESLRWRVVIRGEGELPDCTRPVLVREIGAHPEFYVALCGCGTYQWQPLTADLSIQLDDKHIYCDEKWARKDPRSEYRYRMNNGEYNKNWNKLGEKLAGERYKEERLFRIPKYPEKKFWEL